MKISKFLSLFLKISLIIYDTKENETMYRVIEMYGDFEPWWFIDGWEEDVIRVRNLRITMTP